MIMYDLYVRCAAAPGGRPWNPYGPAPRSDELSAFC